ncbi:MAG TPA: DUF3352 domain-containing protein [Solirubrobacteraceae bacterium]|jgi:hypothetical protein|nr:DUF3352 domain-containing protein [Solirubrobacteraceae bacterium]
MPLSARLLRLTAGLLAAATVSLAAACGGSGGDPSADPAALVPARAGFYVEGNFKPGEDVEELVKKLSGEDDPGGALKRLIEKEGRENDRSFKYSDDVEPWLGDRAGLFLLSLRAGSDDDPPVAVVFPTKDADKAKEAFEKRLRKGDEGEKPQVVERTHRDTKYLVDTSDDEGIAIVDDYAVFGSDEAIKGAIDAREGESLAESSEYDKARSAVPDDEVGFLYVRLSQLFSQLGPQGAAVRQALSGVGETFALGIDGDANAIRLATAGLGVSGAAGPTGPGKVFRELPSSAWAAAGTADLGGQIERMIRQFAQLGALGGQSPEQLLDRLEAQLGIDPRRDLAAWLGDVGFFVFGDTPAELGGGLIATTKDAAATRRSIPRLARFLQRTAGMRARPLRRSGVDTGVTLTPRQLPLPIHIALTRDDRFVVAVTDPALAQAVQRTRPLAETPEFKDAEGELGEGLEAQVFVNFEAIRSLVDATGAGSDKNVAQIRKALDRLTTLVAGTKRQGDTSRGRLVIGVK